VWGAWHGLLSALESLRVFDVRRWRRSAAGKLLSRVYTLLAVCLGFAMFRAESVTSGFTLIAAMFTGWDFTLEGTVLLQTTLGGWTACMLVLGVVCSAPVLERARALLKGRALAAADVLSYVACTALFVVSCAAMASGGFAPFIYFQF
jgi:hypothetical protein